MNHRNLILVGVAVILIAASLWAGTSLWRGPTPTETARRLTGGGPGTDAAGEFELPDAPAGRRAPSADSDAAGSAGRRLTEDPNASPADGDAELDDDTHRRTRKPGRKGRRAPRSSRGKAESDEFEDETQAAGGEDAKVRIPGNRVRRGG